MKGRKSIGPRDLKDPSSKEYAEQLLDHIRRLINDKKWFDKAIDDEIAIIDKYKYWKLFGKRDREELLKEWTGYSGSDIQKERAMYLANNPPELGEPHRPSKGDNISRKIGTDRIAARIADRRPDILKRMKAGEFNSVHAAAVEAGIVKPTASVPKTKEGFVAYIKRTFTHAEIRWIREQL